MNGSLSDVIGVLVATLLGLPLVVLPGYALGMAGDTLGFRALEPGRRFLCAAFLGIGLLPLIDSLLVQALGVPAAALANLGLAAAALAPAARDWRGRIDRPAVALAALWLGVVAYALIDIDTGAALHQPVAVIDLVKHAALTRSIVESGVPPLDPFFARPERVSYYYFFYTLCALVDWLGGALVDGRTAFAGLAFWTGIGLLGLLDRLFAASGLVRETPAALVRGAVLLLLPAGGLDVVLALRARLLNGTWTPVAVWLNEEVSWWPASLIWVPHHVAAALAGWLGLLALAEAAEGPRAGRAQAAAVAVAGIAFAACAGLSVWVCIGTVVSAGAWLALLVVERRWRDAGRLAAAGLLSLLLAAPYLVGVLANRGVSGAALAFAIRAFGPVEGVADAVGEPTMSVVRLVLLPVNYYFGFGAFAAGALLFWRLVPRTEAHRREAGRLLTCCAGTGLLLGGFLRSVIINNDFGWRVLLLAQVAALVWTVAALVRVPAVRVSSAPARLRLPGTLAALLALGYATSLYALVEMRAYPVSGDPGLAFVNARADIDRDLRAAYAWAAAHLPADLVLQQDPSAARVFDFGLYGRHRVAVADADAGLFGVPAAAVDDRLRRVAPIFRRDLSGPEARRRAAGAGVQALVVTAQDAPWRDPDSWVWRTPAAYAGPRVRILRVGDLDG